MTNRIGNQEPTGSFILPYTQTEGDLAVELYRMTGKEPHEWQQLLTYDIMAIGDDGLWIHTTFGLEVSRQNGKGEVILMRELYGLANKERILHTAHLVDTAHSAFERLEAALQDLGLVKDKDYTAIKAKGQEVIELKDGGRIEFRTRTEKGGLGRSYDLLIIDEAQEYQTTQQTALKYVIAASKNPQTILCGTPPTAVSSGTVFKDLREDVLSGTKSNTGWAEWSVSELSDPTDRELWYLCNPSLGLTLSERQIADEVSTSEDGKIDFNIQRLGFWLKYSQKSVISLAAWEEICEPELPALKGQLTIGIKYNVDGTTVSMAVAARTTGDRIFTEVVGRQPVRNGTDWILNFLKATERNTFQVVIDGKNGQQMLMDEMLDADLPKPVLVTTKEVIEANQRFETEIYQKTMCHMEQPSLTKMVSNCIHRAIGTGGGFGWKPINDLQDISLMECVALAVWARRINEDYKQQIYY